jgi:hypothetical protein
MSVSDLYIPMIDLPISAAGNMWTDPGDMQIAHRHMIVEIGTGAEQFPEKEYINAISVAVQGFRLTSNKIWQIEKALAFFL